MYNVQITTIEEFRDSRGCWNNLVLKMAEPTIFCTWEWIYGWWEHFGQRYEAPVILFVRSGDELKGIMPLVRHAGMFKHRWLIGRILSYCGSNDLFSDQVDIIAAPEDASTCLEAVFHFLHTEYRSWDVIELPLFREDSSIASWSRARDSNIGGLVCKWFQASVAPYIPLKGRTFEDFTASLDKQKRYYLRTRAKKLQEKGIAYGPCKQSGESQGMEALFGLHEARAQKRGLRNSSFAGTQMLRFHQEFTARISGHGWLWLRFLQGESGTVAAFYGFLIGNCVLFYQIGFDPTWEKFSPGMAIVDEALREACSSGCSEFNFLQGNEKYKSFWTGTHHILYAGYIYNDTAFGRISRTVFRAKLKLKAYLKKPN